MNMKCKTVSTHCDVLSSQMPVQECTWLVESQLSLMKKPAIAEHCRTLPMAPCCIGHVPPFSRFVLTRSEFVAETWQHVPYFLGPKKHLCKAKFKLLHCQNLPWKTFRKDQGFLNLFAGKTSKQPSWKQSQELRTTQPAKIVNVVITYAEILALPSICLSELILKQYLQYRFDQVITPSSHFISFLVFTPQMPAWITTGQAWTTHSWATLLTDVVGFSW